jgi:hypothetical protein
MLVAGVAACEGNDIGVKGKAVLTTKDSIEQRDIHLMWIIDEGIPPPIWCHSGAEGTAVDRLSKLRREQVEHERKARRDSDDAYANLQPPTAPQEFHSTNLFQLLDLKKDFIPWASLEHGGKEFELRWNEFQKSSHFENKMNDVVIWWYCGKALV